MDEASIADRLRRQTGLISRSQVVAAGGTDALIRRKIRRREWARVHDGVFVAHTGPLSWLERAWAAVLYHDPSALAGRSALRAHGLRSGGGEDMLELVVDRGRRVADPAGVLTRQSGQFAAIAQLNLGPPRVRVEHAALAVASDSTSQDAAVAVLADVCQQRRSTPERLLTALGSHPRLPRRALLVETLEDVRSGANSALERRYLRDVEDAHGLPRARRQSRVVTEDGASYRDAEYPAYGLVVELDGRLGHEFMADRWADLDRDIAAAEAGSATVRAGWRQLLQPCRLAGSVGRLLRARGWPGSPVGCSDGCPVGRRHRGGSRAGAA